MGFEGIGEPVDERLAMLGVDRVAVSSFVLDHEDPAAAVRQLRRAGR